MRDGEWVCPEYTQRVVMTFMDHACNLCGWRPNVYDDADLRIELKAARDHERQANARALAAEAENKRLRIMDRKYPGQPVTQAAYDALQAAHARAWERIDILLVGLVRLKEANPDLILPAELNIELMRLKATTIARIMQRSVVLENKKLRQLIEELVRTGGKMPGHRTSVPHYDRPKAPCDCDCCIENREFWAALKAAEAALRGEVADAT